MARSTPVKKAIRSLTWLVILMAVLAGLNTAASVLAGNTKDDSGKWFEGASWVPELALDLQGGTQLTLAAQNTEGGSVTSQQLNQAVNIIRQRINATGVSESQINTQGTNNIVVSIPGKPDKATIDRIEAAAKLTFRPVLYTEAATNTAVGGSGSSSASATPYSPPASLAATPSAKPTNGSDLNWVTPALQDLYTNYNCNAPDDVTTAPDDEPLVTCDQDGAAKYILGPVEVSGSGISNATSGLATDSQGTSTGQWAVNLTFKGKSSDDFRDVTSRLVKLQPPQNQFAIVLDGSVITAPASNAAITNGKAQITGSFTADSAKTLADQLKYGALPINFQVQSNENISATLGTAQLVGGLVAGLIGLILVIIYSVIQYRALAFVTVLSLGVAAALTYLVIAIMSWRVDYRLSLAGVAGLIVAIGITADSFIVYFERIRDELRDGRGLESAVESGWKRALRTILASDSINFLAAVVLYILAVSDVKGFAFTLLLTTLIDVVVVVMFTHPMMQLIARSRFFGEGHRFSGLDPAALGAVYRGRAQFRAPVVDGRRQRSAGEAQRRQTIAERKAAQASGENGTTPDGKDD
ncbi:MULTISPECIES: protein translocase subunit SecD [unclassified Curtobacterium]|uniref:protein translocase subunit SecD n=1 Tax=unclassified Curtobacterium TaxID=257496 RepID=UPI0008DD4A2A|nr:MULTISPECIES: protein translocase subunit SecD [unclassified Curtobacterium]MCC8908094.1 protein translocase subunit SecD [Curtobacterium sp. GD1]MCT9622065.1 protein translocase subunit SecD [Curtobacterium sp. C2H10]OII26651.1 protein-export membrane protein SecD [Curtobacterium sp. MCBA15_016]OII28569.1 protein-export membrane protein SecD [Curtobacterium sp. MCBA15_013]SFF78296.1 preprotein translocase subunit SecD [Curtobacterium sp. YR515]